MDFNPFQESSFDLIIESETIRSKPRFLDISWSYCVVFISGWDGKCLIF